ncbi:MAG: hypothetical protein KJO66_06155 [Gammaproteobacteria bacterium]|nr:hypothetical protein [Gammaproteobacteria bacterium]
MRGVRGKLTGLFYFLVACLVIACGGEQLAGGGIGGTGITSGTLTGFGSVFVNGVEFDTGGASRTVDDVTSISNGMDDIAVMGQGMVITVSGTVNADGVSGTATSIEFDEVIEGPVGNDPVEDPDAVTKSFDILGTNVVVNRNTTVFVDVDYTSIARDDLIEVSGYFDAAGNLLATHVDKEGVLAPGSTVEVHGTVSGFNGIDTFMLGGVTVVYDGATVFENLPGGIVDGQFVEASGPLNGAMTVDAARIQLEDDSIMQTASISLEGIVTQFNGTGDFLVRGQRVDASSAGFYPAMLAATLGDDDRVEVTGTLAGGVLRATAVEDRGGSIKIAGLVSSVDSLNGVVTVEVVAGQPLIVINVDTQTQLEDDLGAIQPFTLTDLMPGNEVIVEGVGGAGNSVDALKLKRRLLDKYELQGSVQAAAGDSMSGTITLLGVVFATDNSTKFEDSNDQQFPNGGDDFYPMANPGALVEIEDKKPVDGIADEVELKS